MKYAYVHFAFLALSILNLNMSLNAQEITIQGIHYATHEAVSVVVENGKISKILPLSKKEGQNLPWIAPGLIDNQVNGYNGVSFAFGGSDLSEQDVIKASRAMWKNGVTTYLPTLTTNDNALLTKNLKILAKAKNRPELYGAIPGFHLEGPYISPIDGFRGAHPKQHVRKVDWEEFMGLYRASDKNILTVTLAPEIAGAMDFIQKCSTMGIVIALGHHNASKAQIDSAARLGAKICTHLGNGCANMINRHENPLWPQLANEGLAVSIICDGFHLREEEIQVFYAVKKSDKTILTSDITSFAGLPPGQYLNEDGHTIELLESGLLRYPEQNVLYGSATPINRGVVHIMNVTGCSLAEAIKMGSSNPAQLYKLNDRGALKPGKRADLILFRLGKDRLEILSTYLKGNLVYGAKI
ncbi:MAG: amidohydrolase family protein [Bacteroidota bacterium]